MRIHPLAAIWALAILLVIAITLTACGDRKSVPTWQEIITQRMTEAHKRYQDHQYGCYEAYRVGMELGLAPGPLDDDARLGVVIPMMKRLNCPTIANIGPVLPDKVPTVPIR